MRRELKPSTVRYGTASTGSLVHCPFARLPNFEVGCNFFLRFPLFPSPLGGLALFPRDKTNLSDSHHGRQADTQCFCGNLMAITVSRFCSICYNVQLLIAGCRAPFQPEGSNLFSWPCVHHLQTDGPGIPASLMFFASWRLCVRLRLLSFACQDARPKFPPPEGELRPKTQIECSSTGKGKSDSTGIRGVGDDDQCIAHASRRSTNSCFRPFRQGGLSPVR